METDCGTEYQNLPAGMNQRILIIAPRFPISDDRIIATWALQQAKALQRNGSEVEVISPSPYIPKPVGELLNYKQWSTLDSCKTFDGMNVFYPRVPVYDTNKTKFLYNRLPRLEMELMWQFSQRAIQKSVNSFDPDVLLCHHPLPGGYIGMKVETEYEIPYVTVEHSLVDIRRTANNPRRHKLYREVFENSIINITVSEMMSKHIKKQLELKGDIEVIYNGYDPGEVKSPSNTPTRDKMIKQTNILCVGSFVERKGHQYLLKALSRVRTQIDSGISCTLVGDGPEETELKKIVDEHDLNEIVRFRSGLTREKLNRLMDSSDLFVLPSWDEPCAVVYPEVMAHGVPAVMCEGQGFSELIEDEETGFLIPPRDVDALADILRRLISNPKWINQVGQEARTLVEAKLTWNHNASRTTMTIEEYL